jgi:hypothetical protein
LPSPFNPLSSWQTAQSQTENDDDEDEKDWGGPRHLVPGYDRTVPPGLGAVGKPVRPVNESRTNFNTTIC